MTATGSMPRATNRQRSAARATRPLAVGKGRRMASSACTIAATTRPGAVVGRSDTVPARSAAPTSRRHRAPAAAPGCRPAPAPDWSADGPAVFRAQIGRGQLVQSGPDLHRGGVDLGSEPHQLTGDRTAPVASPSASPVVPRRGSPGCRPARRRRGRHAAAPRRSRPSRPCAAHGPQQHVDRVPGRPGRRPDPPAHPMARTHLPLIPAP